MKYILDTNIYIDSYDRHYRNEFFPTYWDMFSRILNEYVVIPEIVRSEITKNEWFLEWLKTNYHGQILNHKIYSQQWQEIISYIQSCGYYTDRALTDQSKGWATDSVADPWLIAIAKQDNFTIVSEENTIPNLGKGNPVRLAKIPDICQLQKVRCINKNQFFQETELKV